MSRRMRMVLALVIVKALVPPVGSLLAIRFHVDPIRFDHLALCFTVKETLNVSSQVQVTWAVSSNKPA